MGCVRTKTVKKSSCVVIKRYYSRRTLDFHTHKKILEEVVIIPSKRLRNKIAGFSTHLMRRIQRGPIRGISLKLEEEEKEQTLFDEEEEEVEEEEDGQEQNASAAQMSIDDVALSDSEAIDVEPVEKLLEPFSKDQLIDLLLSAASVHLNVLSSIHRFADVDPVHRKIFVHGLERDTDAEALIAAFKKYGEIEDCNAIRDKITGKPKGLTLFVYRTIESARKAL